MYNYDPLHLLLPPTSDINTTLVPVGDCSNISISSGMECLTPFIVTDFTVAFAGKPATAIVDGYGAPAPAAVEPGATPGIVTEPPEENVLVSCTCYLLRLLNM